LARASNSGINQPLAEMPLDPPPTTGKISIVRGQGKDYMQMIGQNYNRINRERALATSRAESTA
jgi:hypothetical protein